VSRRPDPEATVSERSVLVLGGSGFMGTPAAAALQARGARVSVLSRGRRPLPGGVESIVADRRDPATLSAALECRRFDFTVDFTAYDASDIECLLLVPRAPLGRYVMISTGQVYLVTEGARGPFREEDSEREVLSEPPADSPDHAEWRYGVGKRRAEGVVFGLRASHGLRATVLRLPIVQGEHDGSLRLWAYIERLLDGGPLLLPDGGTRPIRHVDTRDVTRAIVRLFDGPEPRERVYNLAQPETVTLRELLERVAAVLGLPPRLIEAPWSELHAAGIERVASPYAGPWSSVPDPARAAAELGLAGTSIEHYLPRVVRWHVENRPQTSHRGYAFRAKELEFAAAAGRGA
jgi:nucleoside-diphosphate-sugar epimerase